MQEIRGERIRGRRQATLEITREGRVSGNAGCNGIGGEVKISRNRVDFGRMISTQMACAPDIMRQERQFIEALEGARSFRLEPRRGTLERSTAAAARPCVCAAPNRRSPPLRMPAPPCWPWNIPCRFRHGARPFPAL